MRKPVLPHLLLLLILYAAVFITLVHFQFAKRTNFTIREGDLVITGRHAGSPGRTANVHLLEGSARVFFGGMEFILGEGLALFGAAGSSAGSLLPESLTVADNEVYFHLKDGPVVIFTTQYSSGAIELVIRADFSLIVPAASGAENAMYYSLKIPYKALNTSIVQETQRQLLVNANGKNYTFNRATERGLIFLEAQNPSISYRVVPDKESANPRDFIITSVLDAGQYEAAVALWLDQSYLLWNRTAAAGGELTGDLINAYMSEALKRGGYRAAQSAVLAVWNPANMSYQSSAFTGRLDTALRTLTAAESERSGRLARLFNEKSLDFLKENGIIEYLAIRGYDNLMDDAAEIVRTLDPAAMTTEQAAGILECHTAWLRYRPGMYNPFDRFVDQALFVITGSLQKNPRMEGALVFANGSAVEASADIELNLRLGRNLLRYEDETRNALGKTLILSVLSLADRTGAVPRRIGDNFLSDDVEKIESQRVYRLCFAGDNYAHAQAVLGGGIWAWTAASSIGGSHGTGRLEITVNFPAGETHYLIIRGIKPFTALQFNGITYGQNTQFERYDNSGWVYSASEQSLLVKIRHRMPAEKITVIY